MSSMKLLLSSMESDPQNYYLCQQTVLEEREETDVQNSRSVSVPWQATLGSRRLYLIFKKEKERNGGREEEREGKKGDFLGSI